MVKNERVGLKGVWEISTVDLRTNKVIDKEVKENMIVNTGLERIAKLLNGVNTTYFDFIAIGSDNTAVQETDTALGAEVDRKQATTAYETDYKATLEALFLFDAPNVIREAGGFSSDNVMLNRVIFSDKNVDENTGLYVKFTITVSR